MSKPQYPALFVITQALSEDQGFFDHDEYVANIWACNPDKVQYFETIAASMSDEELYEFAIGSNDDKETFINDMLPGHQQELRDLDKFIECVFENEIEQYQ